MGAALIMLDKKLNSIYMIVSHCKSHKIANLKKLIGYKYINLPMDFFISNSITLINIFYVCAILHIATYDSFLPQSSAMLPCTMFWIIMLHNMMRSMLSGITRRQPTLFRIKEAHQIFDKQKCSSISGNK